MKNKHYNVSGRFYIDVNKIVSAKSGAEAMRKLRDRTVAYRKIKKSDWARDEAQAIEME